MRSRLGSVPPFIAEVLESELVLIGPDGKIAATDPEGEDIVKRVEQALKDRGPR